MFRSPLPFLLLLLAIPSFSEAAQMACGNLALGYTTGTTFQADDTATGACKDERGSSCSNTVFQSNTILTCDDNNLSAFARCCIAKGRGGIDVSQIQQRMVPPTNGTTGGYQVACAEILSEGQLRHDPVLTRRCGGSYNKTCGDRSLSCFVKRSRDIGRFGKCCTKGGKGFFVRSA